MCPKRCYEHWGVIRCLNSLFITESSKNKDHIFTDINRMKGTCRYWFVVAQNWSPRALLTRFQFTAIEGIQFHQSPRHTSHKTSGCRVDCWRHRAIAKTTAVRSIMTAGCDQSCGAAYMLLFTDISYHVQLSTFKNQLDIWKHLQLQ
jgi:hypothetical protein